MNYDRRNLRRAWRELRHHLWINVFLNRRFQIFVLGILIGLFVGILITTSSESRAIAKNFDRFATAVQEMETSVTDLKANYSVLPLPFDARHVTTGTFTLEFEPVE